MNRNQPFIEANYFFFLLSELGLGADGGMLKATYQTLLLESKQEKKLLSSPKQNSNAPLKKRGHSN